MMKKDKNIAQKNSDMLRGILLIVCLMIGAAYASVPLYDLFCRVTGFGGTTQIAESAPASEDILERKITVNFLTSTSRDMPWQFKSETSKLTLNIGQEALINFKALNPTNTPVTGTALYNVTPLKAGKYFHKTACFCFDKQTLLPKQDMNMPVIFFVDPSINDDPDLSDLSTITLSYTFFKSGSVQLDEAMSELQE